MWRCCCACCDCCQPSVQDETTLLGCQRPQDGHLYTVRRISSFGRTVSKEDLDDSYTDLRSVTPHQFSDNIAGQLKVCRVQPEANDCEYATSTPPPTPSPAGRRKGRWHRALDTLRPRSNKNLPLKAVKQSATLPSITVSSPDIVRDIKMQEAKQSVPVEEPNLRHAGTMVDISSVSVLNNTASWLKSQSMQDITSETELHIEGESTPKTKSGDLARSFGIDTSLYTTSRSSSPGAHYQCGDIIDSIYTLPDISGKECTVAQDFPSGIFDFSCSYFPKSKKLLVHVSKIEDLEVKNENNTYEINLRLTILPAEKHNKNSKSYKVTQVVEIEEDFQFTLKDISEKILRISVYNIKNIGKYSAIGHTLLNLEDVPFGKAQRYSLKLYKQSQQQRNLGNVMVSMSYQSSDQQLIVHVKKAKSLSGSHIVKNNKATVKWNTFVKISCFCGDEKIKTKKSPVIQDEQNPVYDYSCALKLPSEHSDECYVVISVMMKGLFKKDIPIGRLILGPSFYSGHAATIWGRVMLYHESITHWFPLYL
ncbi:synaptotagmin-15-like [Schistocerca nitens]|uniref:synaptotagmin-15-like n=1 Tax=Schistocerca nitens TaxID=7011 RepID=UPI002117934E|nr:synaptotagmin-15-like [Schistocerca nitens]XP_049799476.1 synaptotagmin-15-like [Schistocerca nitens]